MDQPFCLPLVLDLTDVTRQLGSNSDCKWVCINECEAQSVEIYQLLRQ
jgi:hypothetical protein